MIASLKALLAIWPSACFENVFGGSTGIGGGVTGGTGSFTFSDTTAGDFLPEFKPGEDDILLGYGGNGGGVLRAVVTGGLELLPTVGASGGRDIFCALSVFMKDFASMIGLNRQNFVVEKCWR
jgi:hypothetical protein